MIKSIPYGKQYITEEDIQAVIEVLKSDYLTQGPTIEQFEQAFAQYIGSKYAVAVANGTAALHLAVLALNLEKGKKVITTPITFAASANCVLYAGGEVEFVDIDPKTYTIDINKIDYLLKRLKSNEVRGIIPVDLAGYPVNMEDLKQIAERYGLWLLEDACHAPGGAFKDSEGNWQQCGNGTYSDAAIFSFHPVKHIATGEGGMITTNNKDLYEKLKILRTHGITRDKNLLSRYDGGWYYEMQMLGFNYRITDIQAALGISQLKRAQQGLIRRRQIAQVYLKELSNVGDIVLPYSNDTIKHAYHLFIIQTNYRKELYEFLRTKNIFCQVHYIPIHTFPFYQQFGWKWGDFPVAESYYQKCLSLPMFPTLSDDEISYVIHCIKAFFQNKE
ncbi:MAG: UDP-4-amino-4,6-dideoxy-N-acetyl-beta-L-altrosamine transaminase [Bacteroidales bacterium]|nr:UDP-4-amino-4,6-dideoxy-N-acetyl-beta-L-altrosamine transaminase [Bacteroidales bacterium]